MSETPRHIAQEVLEKIERQDAYSHIALDAALQASGLDGRDRGLATELVYGTLTWQRALDRVLDEFVRGGVDKLDLPVLVALRVGAYQLIFLDRIPAHAAVDEAVQITKQGPSGAASGLVNAVLRNIVRNRDDITWWSERNREAKPARYIGQRWSLPNWIGNRLLQYHGFERAEQMAEAFDRRPPLYLRLTGAFEGPELPEGVTLVDGVPGAARADGFSEEVRYGLEHGHWTVQDLGSQLIGLFTGARPGESVLDGCAGLGGKTLHLARLVGVDGDVVALDPASTKIEMLAAAADLTRVSDWVDGHVGELQGFAQSDGREFDRVLVDAPCSGLGVIRRHPETRWRRQEADIFNLTKLQVELLDAAAALVRPGGVLTYGVCTFTNEEGPKQIDAFLERHDGWERADAPQGGEGAQVDWQNYLDEAGQLSLNPLDHDTDAFFAARLRRL